MANSTGARRRPFTNGIKPIHAIVLVVFLLVRYTYGGVDLRARRSANEEGLHDLSRGGHHNSDTHSTHHEPQLRDESGDHSGEEGHAHGYEVFHVGFERVELPFIIALWIFVSSLAKIGERAASELFLPKIVNCLSNSTPGRDAVVPLAYVNLRAYSCRNLGKYSDELASKLFDDRK